MKTFKLFWNLHKWTGLCAALIVCVVASSGLLLLMKKRAAWIQPPTMVGAPGEAEDFITTQRLFDVVLALGHPDFGGLADIDRVDFRPGDRVFKVQSEHHHAEVQVCAVTGSVLSVATRPSDLIENIHDGSFFGPWMHNLVMPAFAITLLFICFSGFWLWIEPKMRRRRRKKLRRASA